MAMASFMRRFNGVILVRKKLQHCMGWCWVVLTSGARKRQKFLGIKTGGGRGGDSKFQVMGMIEWEQKSKPKNSLGNKT